MNGSTGNKGLKLKSPFPLWPVLLWILIFIGAAFLFFGFSVQSVVSTLSVKGNQYYSVQDIYAIGSVKPGSSLLADSAMSVENRLRQDPLIENATVTVDGNEMKIDVDEKDLVGYLVDEQGITWLVPTDGTRLQVSEDSALKSALQHLPLIHDLDDETIARLCSIYQQYPQYLNSTVTGKIAEITHWEESFDDNMIRLVMQDGNEAVTTLESYFMIGRYQDALSLLLGQNVCLYLDGDNHSVDKIGCDYMHMSKEERDEARMLLRQQLEAQAKAQKEQAEKEAKEKAEREAREKAEKEQADQQTAQNPEQSAQTENPDQNGTEEAPAEKVWIETDDWQPSDYSWLQYSPSHDIYMDNYGQSQFRFDQGSQSFVPLQ